MKGKNNKILKYEVVNSDGTVDVYTYDTSKTPPKMIESEIGIKKRNPKK